MEETRTDGVGWHVLVAIGGVCILVLVICLLMMLTREELTRGEVGWVRQTGEKEWSASEIRCIEICTVPTTMRYVTSYAQAFDWYPTNTSQPGSDKHKHLGIRDIYFHDWDQHLWLTDRTQVDLTYQGYTPHFPYDNHDLFTTFLVTISLHSLGVLRFYVLTTCIYDSYSALGTGSQPF